MAISWAIAHSFGVLGRFSKTVTPDTCLIVMKKNLSFHVLWPFPWAIVHNFGILERFGTTVTPDTCLRVMTKKSSFSHFMAVFISYCPHFVVTGRFTTTVRTDICLRTWQKTRRFGVYGRFHELFPIVLGFTRVCMARKTPDMFESYDPKVAPFRVFMIYCPQFWGSSAIYNECNTRYKFKCYDQKLVVFAFYGRFHELLPIVWGF